MRAYAVARKATNQNLIPRPRDVNVHLTGDKSKLGPQLMYQFITPPQTQNLHQRRDLGQNGETRINCPTAISNKVFCKGIFSVPHHQWTLQNAGSLARNFLLAHGVALKIQHTPAGSLQTKTLISDEMLCALIMTQDLVHAVRQHRHILPAQTAIEVTWLPGSIRWPSHEKTTKFTSGPHLLHFEALLPTDSPPRLTDVRFIAASVACL